MLGMTGWQQLPEVPEWSRITHKLEQGYRLKVAYGSPIRASRMLGKKLVHHATMDGSYRTITFSDPFTTEYTAGVPRACSFCGRFGHLSRDCQEAQGPDVVRDACATCALLGHTSRHTLTAVCPIARGFRANAQAMLSHIVERREQRSVFGGRHREWFENFFSRIELCTPSHNV